LIHFNKTTKIYYNIVLIHDDDAETENTPVYLYLRKFFNKRMV